MSIQSDLSNVNKNKKKVQVVKRNSIRARCFTCGNSLSVVNRHYYCNSCRNFTVQVKLNDKPRMNKLPR